jgi:hypothetical protein
MFHAPDKVVISRPPGLGQNEAMKYQIRPINKPPEFILTIISLFPQIIIKEKAYNPGTGKTITC